MTTLLICAAALQARRSLERCAVGIPGLDRVETVADVAHAEALARRQVPDVVLLDARLPGAGPRTIRLLATGESGSRVFLFGIRDDYAAMAVALASGASGFLRSNLSSAELAAVLAHVPARHCPADVGPVVVSPADVGSGDQESAQPPAPRGELTGREVQVLRGMAAGKSNGEIGRGLFLSEDTVKTHAQRLFRKLGVNDRAHAVALGFRLGIVC